jgi:CRISPR-associated Csx2 family protein
MKALTFLGINNYAETIYVYQGKEYPTRFFAAALPHFFPQLEEILLFVTPQVQEHANLKALQESLGERLRPAPIPEGHTQEDLWTIFDALTAQIQPGEQVLFDITNSFRSLPFLVFLAAAFLRSARQIQVAGVLYGAWDARNTETNRTPVFDLTPFVTLLDWLTATNRFVETGDGHALASLLQAGMPSGPQMGRDLQARALGKNLESAADAIRSISLAVRLARPLEIMQSAAQLDATIQQALPVIQKTARPFGLLASQIVDEYSQFALEDPTESTSQVESLYSQLELIHWYLERRHVIQAATLAREWVISLLAWRLNAPMFELENGRDALEKALNTVVEKRKPDPKPKYRSPYEKPIADLPEVDQLCALWNRLRDIRNDIAHCGMRISPRNANLLKQKVELLFPELAELARQLLPPRMSAKTGGQS